MGPTRFLARVVRGTTNNWYTKNRIIFAQGDVCITLFFIQNGKVKRAAASPMGKRQSSESSAPIRMTDCVIVATEKPVMIRIPRAHIVEFMSE
jgi:hypothetical protein